MKVITWKSRWYFLFEYEMSLSENTYVSRLNDWSAFTRNVRDQISIEHIFRKIQVYYIGKINSEVFRKKLTLPYKFNRQSISFISKR